MPARSEIDDKFKWAVSDLYSSDEAWEKDYNSILELTDQPSELKGRMGESAGMLYKALKEYEQVEYITERVYVYAFMKYYEDTGNSKYQEISGKAQMAAMKVSEKYAFLEPELISIDADVLDKYISEDERLGMYKHFIDDCLIRFLKRRKHCLQRHHRCQLCLMRCSLSLTMLMLSSER